MPTEAQESAKLSQLHHAKPDEIEVAAGRQREWLEGAIPPMVSDDEVRDALEKAFDYRGDVSLTLKDGSSVDGYLFDRRPGRSLETSFLRIIPSTNKMKRTISYADIRSLTFSGRDTAAGRTFEAWVRKYWEKKAAGESNIHIEPEKLD